MWLKGQYNEGWCGCSIIVVHTTQQPIPTYDRTLLLLTVLYLSTPALLHTLCTPSSIPEVCCICSIIQFYRHTGVTGFRDLPGFQIRSLKIIVTATTYNTTTYNDFLSLASTDFVYRRFVLCLQFHHLVFI